MSEKFYINYRDSGDKKTKELFEIESSEKQVVIRSSLERLKLLHITNHHKPDEVNNDACWHVKRDKDEILLEIRRDVVLNQFVDLGFVIFKSQSIKECKNFNRKAFKDTFTIENDDSFNYMTVYFFQCQKSFISNRLNSVLKKNFPKKEDTPGRALAFYFEGSSEISVGCVIIFYNISTVQFLSLVGLVNNVAHLIPFITVARDGNIKKEFVVTSFEKSVQITGNNYLPAGGIMLD